MTTPPNESEERWERLLRQARADTPPPVDVAALHRVVRSAETEQPDWVAEFYALFAARGVAPACLASASVLVGVTSWEVWDVWQALPWAQLLLMRGGTP